MHLIKGLLQLTMSSFVVEVIFPLLVYAYFLPLLHYFCSSSLSINHSLQNSEFVDQDFFLVVLVTDANTCRPDANNIMNAINSSRGEPTNPYTHVIFLTPLPPSFSPHSHATLYPHSHATLYLHSHAILFVLTPMSPSILTPIPQTRTTTMLTVSLSPL